MQALPSNGCFSGSIVFALSKHAIILTTDLDKNKGRGFRIRT
jgi:hypothetical protein